MSTSAPADASEYDRRIAEEPTNEVRAAEREAAAWLATISADTIATIAEASSETIVPDRGERSRESSATDSNPSTGGGRALASIEELRGDIHRVRLGDVIGEGGMGVVRSAEQVALGRTVAVKTLKAGRRSQTAGLDLLREAWVTGGLEHPNIVPVHAVDLDADGTPSIVMKRITGVEWSALITDAQQVARRFGAKDLLAWNLQILMRVLDAVRFAHSHGIVHRDLKPSNVMIGDYGEVYLLDWGIAVSLRDDGTGRFPLAANAHQLAGTPAYMAPEMLARDGGPPLSERTDVYLAGAVLHQLITGRPPHVGTNALAIFASVIASCPELPPGTPPELAQICLRALHEDPARRFESANALRLAIQDYLEHRGSEQLTTRTRALLDELRVALAAERADADTQRDTIYRLFGACRYGFRDALAVWPENPDAAAGLHDAIVAVAEYELADGRAHAAVTLLGELAEPTPILERARAAAVVEARRVVALERLEREHDKQTGTRTRSFITFVLGIVFTVVPLVIANVSGLEHASHALHIAFAIVTTLILAATGFWARASMLATVLNRRLLATVMFVFIMQAAIAAASALAGRPSTDLFIWDLLLYSVISGMLTIAVDTYLWPAAAAYLVSFVLCSAEPAPVLYLSAGCNLLLAGLATWRWRPASLRYSEAERTRRKSELRA